MSEFESWALVELFGHTRIAGLVKEQSLGSISMLRIDVPGNSEVPAFTKIVHPNAVYAINPITEELARQMAASFHVKPIQAWDITKYLHDAKALLDTENLF